MEKRWEKMKELEKEITKSTENAVCQMQKKKKKKRFEKQERQA